jgi:DedD protein
MMERALKERIIGAAILVVVVILIVPVFLDGPPAENEVVTTSVPLPGQSEQDVRTVVLDRDRTDPVPVAASSKDKPPVPKPEAAAKDDKPAVIAVTPVQEPDVTPKASPAVEQPKPKEDPAPPVAAPANTSTTGMWAVQLGSFSDQNNAERLAADLRKQGFAAFLSKLPTDSGELHRVRIGPQKDRASAEAMAERLRKAGHKGKVLPHP